MAKIASERLDEMQDPELTIDRALEQKLQLGYSENWINQQLKSIEINVTRVAFKALEAKTGKKVVTTLNAKHFYNPAKTLQKLK